MSEEQRMQLIDEPPVGEAIDVPAPPAATAPVQLDDATADQAAHDRYLDTLHDLMVDAASNERMHLFADVLAWTFARLAINFGPGATADLLAKVGKYMGALEEQNRAQRELEKAREEGRVMN